MVEELTSAGATSIPYALAVYYLCELRGSFFVVWLIFYITNAVGIGGLPPCLWISSSLDNIHVAHSILHHGGSFFVLTLFGQASLQTFVSHPFMCH